MRFYCFCSAGSLPASERPAVGMTMLGQHLTQTGQLSDRIEFGEVRDVLWTYTAVELYELLVFERGWSVERYAEWLGQAIIGALMQSRRATT